MTTQQTMDRTGTVAHPPIVLTQNDYERLSTLVESPRLQELPAVQYLSDELDRAQIVKPEEVSPKVATMHSFVEFRDEQTSELRRVTLVYPEKADIALDKVSVLTPMGAALIGLSEGQSMQWQTRTRGWKRLTLVKVHYQPEANGRFDL